MATASYRSRHRQVLQPEKPQAAGMEFHYLSDLRSILISPYTLDSHKSPCRALGSALTVEGKTPVVDSPPKRPPSSYLKWLNDNRAAIVKKLGSQDVSSVGKARV